MPAKSSQSVVDEILRLRKLGITNRKIAESTGVHHRTVAYHLGKAGLTASRTLSRDRVDGNEATCTRCDVKKPLDAFQYGRRGRFDEYRFSYCTECRSASIARRNKGQSLEWTIKDRVQRIKASCKRKSIEFNLTKEYIEAMYFSQNGRCFYTDVEMEWRYGNQLQRHSISVDKICPDVGYIQGNVVLCSHKANSIKSDLTMEELKSWMPAWHNKIETFLETNSY